MRKTLAVIILILASLACLASCKDREETVYHTVRFDVSYALASMDAPSDAQVADGETVSLPSIEAEATPGNVYIWTKDRDTKTRYDATQPVTEDMTLYAVEVPKRYKIMYLFELDGVVNSSLNPTEYDSTEEIVLEPPLKTTVPFGYKFSHWCYADDKESPVTSIAAGTKGDIVLRARFELARYEVHYRNLRGATNDNADSYLFGDEMTLLPLEAEGFVGFVSYSDPTLEVASLTEEFLSEHTDLVSGGIIVLRAKWSNEQ